MAANREHPQNTGQEAPRGHVAASIAIVTPWYGAFAGGAEYAARQLANQLQSAGADVSVLTTCSRSPYDDWWRSELPAGWCRIDGVPVRRFPVNAEPAGVYHRLLQAVDGGHELDYDDQLDFMRGTINSHALIAYIKQHREGRRFVFLPYLYGPTFWGIKALKGMAVMIPCLHDEFQARWPVMQTLFRSTRQVIFLSPEEQSLAVSLYGDGMAHMPVLGVGIESRAAGDAQRFRRKFGIRSPFLLYAGRKDRGKNVAQLIDFMTVFNQSRPEALQLVFIGGGDASLIPGDRSDMIDLGFVSESDKRGAMRAALAICNLSTMESFSLVIMEGWLQQRPAIVSRQSPVTAGHCTRCNGGFAVSTGEAFCRAVDQLMASPQTATEMGANGKRYVEAHFNWERLLPRYVEAITY